MATPDISGSSENINSMAVFPDLFVSYDYGENNSANLVDFSV